MKTKALLGLMTPLALVASMTPNAEDYLDTIHVPSFTAGINKYNVGNGGDGLTEEDIRHNEEIEAKRHRKK